MNFIEQADVATRILNSMKLKDAEIATLTAKLAAVTQQAQIWKMEAMAHKSTVQECYQACTGSTGEMGDWNGANPVKEMAAKLAEATKPASRRHMIQMEQQFAEAQKDADRYRWLRDSENQHIESDPCVLDDVFNTYFDTHLDEVIDALIARNKTMARGAE